MFTLHEDIIRNYDHNHDAQIGRANSDYRLGGTDRVQTRVEAFEAAKLVLAQSYVQPFGHTAADIDEVYIDSDTNIIDRTPADKTAGRDLIFGEGGADRISGGTMDDIIYGDFGSAPLDRDGGAGDDTLDGDEGKDTLIGGFGADMLEGGTESDLLVGDAYMAMSDGGDGNDTLVGNEGDDTLLGGGGDDSLEGGADNDVLYGGLLNEIPESTDGDDTLDGGGGADQLFGGAGGDRLYGGAGEDVLSGGQEASFPSYTDALYGGAGTDHFVCWGSEVIVDAEANETLTVAGLTPTGGSWQYIGKERTGGESEYADLYGWVGQYGEIYQLVYAEIDGQEDAPVLGIAFYDRIGEYTDDWVPMHGIAIRGWVDDVGFMGINLDGDYWENSLTLDVEDLLGGSAPVPRITGESGVPSAAGVGSLFTAPLQMSDVVTVGPDVIVV